LQTAGRRRCCHIARNSPPLPAICIRGNKNGLLFRNRSPGNWPRKTSCLAVNDGATSACKRLRRSALLRKCNMGSCRAHRALHFGHRHFSVPLDKCMKHVKNHHCRPSTHSRHRPHIHPLRPLTFIIAAHFKQKAEATTVNTNAIPN
jgi:hypothetical protein